MKRRFDIFRGNAKPIKRPAPPPTPEIPGDWLTRITDAMSLVESYDQKVEQLHVPVQWKYRFLTELDSFVEPPHRRGLRYMIWGCYVHWTPGVVPFALPQEPTDMWQNSVN